MRHSEGPKCHEVSDQDQDTDHSNKKNEMELHPYCFQEKRTANVTNYAQKGNSKSTGHTLRFTL